MLPAAPHEQSRITEGGVSASRSGLLCRSVRRVQVACVRVMLWDVRVGGDRRPQLIERLDADVLFLLGVSRKSGRLWTERGAGRYHCATGLELTTKTAT